VSPREIRVFFKNQEPRQRRAVGDSKKPGGNWGGVERRSDSIEQRGHCTLSDSKSPAQKRRSQERKSTLHLAAPRCVIQTAKRDEKEIKRKKRKKKKKKVEGGWVLSESATEYRTV